MSGDPPFQVLVDVVVAVEAGQSHQVPGGAAALLLATQAAVAHPSADRTRPVLQRPEI